MYDNIDEITEEESSNHTRVYTKWKYIHEKYKNRINLIHSLK